MTALSFVLFLGENLINLLLFITDEPHMRTDLTSWVNLTSLAKEMKNKHISDLFNQDNDRFSNHSVQLEGLLFDYSKNLIDDRVFTELVQLIEQTEVCNWRNKMFSGEKINATENRAVLHTALRNRDASPLYVDGQDITAVVKQELSNIKEYVEQVRAGDITGSTGKAFTDVVNIGVGGSNLGPQLVTGALKSFSDNVLKVHYVSNVDGVQISETLEQLNYETTLFIVSSKTFTTVETLTNATTASTWLTKQSGAKQSIAEHFVAVSASKSNAVNFGIKPELIFNMWDWVGGRFSLWSAIGLPIVLYLGYEQFCQLLEGAHEMDLHFKNAEPENNIPMLMAAISVWNTTFLGAMAHVILPYDECLNMLPDYLQQAEMESNGKSVNWLGNVINYPTVPLIWGGTGINGQHAFYQFLHQSNQVIPADFIGSLTNKSGLENHHNTLVANMIAQAQGLMTGFDEAQVREQLSRKGLNAKDIERITPHKIHGGNRPSNMLLLDAVTPHSLGQLIALYEHKIFVQGVILGIYSFDQWGVELGKGLAQDIQNDIDKDSVTAHHDSSTRSLLAYYINHPLSKSNKVIQSANRV